MYVEVNATLGVVEGGDVLEEFPDKGSRLLQEESNHHRGVVLMLNVDSHKVNTNTSLWGSRHNDRYPQHKLPIILSTHKPYHYPVYKEIIQ